MGQPAQPGATSPKHQVATRMRGEGVNGSHRPHLNLQLPKPPNINLAVPFLLHSTSTFSSTFTYTCPSRLNFPPGITIIPTLPVLSIQSQSHQENQKNPSQDGL